MAPPPRCAGCRRMIFRRSCYSLPMRECYCRWGVLWCSKDGRRREARSVEIAAAGALTPLPPAHHRSTPRVRQRQVRIRPNEAARLSPSDILIARRRDPIQPRHFCRRRENTMRRRIVFLCRLLQEEATENHDVFQMLFTTARPFSAR